MAGQNKRPETYTRTGRGGAAHVLPRVQLDTDVMTLAKERIAIAAEIHDNILVAFSGGKDSTVTLQLTLAVLHENPELGAKHLPLRVVFGDEECIPKETEEYVRRVSQRPDVRLEWYCLPLKMRNACSRKHPEWWTWAPESEELWARPLPPEAITHLDGFPNWPPEARLSWPQTNELLAPPHLGNVCILMGIRAQESLTRLRAVSIAGKREYNWLVKQGGGNEILNGSSGGNVWKAYPIYDWLTEDVWTAPKRFGWDYNHAYDLLAMAGVSPAKQRCSPAFGEEPIGGLHVFAQAFPEVWEKMVYRVPGVGSAYRYALTELYGHGSRPERPDDMTWHDFILHFVAKHPDGMRQKLAARLTDIIRRHYRVTSNPMLVKAPHPDSGLSWDWLLMVAMRGDTKQRKQPTNRITREPVELKRMWHRYAKELDDTIKAGQFDILSYPRHAPRDPYALIPEEFR